MNRDEHDDRDVLRDLDPAASLPPATDQTVARLVESAMTDQSPARRSSLTWLAAAAAAVVIAGALGYGLTRGGDAAPTATEPASTPVTATLSAEPVAAKCMVPSAQVLANAGLAVEGTVTDLADGAATLKVSHVYAGKQVDELTVEAPNADMQALIGAVDFEVGQTYLIAGRADSLMVCGFSGPVSPDLTALYEQAFGQ